MITVFGASGFIGSNIVSKLQSLGLPYNPIHRDDNTIGRNLGHVIYCIGLTADFRQKPLQTVDAHICKLLQIIESTQFDSILYLSSTRLYQDLHIEAVETVDISVNPTRFNDLYNLSKATGEAIILNSTKNGRVARLSNVYGFTSPNQETFLSTIIKSALDQKKIRLQSAFDSAKDYVSIANVVDILIKIALSGQSRLYNVASGINTTNRELVDEISRLTDCNIEIEPDAPKIVFPPINTAKIQGEFHFMPDSLLDDLSKLVKTYQEGRT